MIEELAAIARRALTDWRVPGVGIALVTRDDTHVIGVGAQDLASNVEISSATGFPIGSVTKSFTATLAAVLADRAVVDLDAPIIEHVPALRLWDACAREQLTLRDLLSHRTGLPRHDLVWFENDPARDLIRSLRYLAPSAGFRARWQYQNLMYALAGHVLEQATGDSWSTLLEHHVFEPGGLTATGVVPRGDLATLYRADGDSLCAVTPRDLTSIAPAGGLYATVGDLSRWAELQVRGDTFSAAIRRTLHAPQVMVPTAPQDPETAHLAYGLGWFADTYRGHVRIHHPGNIDGCSTRIAAVPDAGVAVVAICNRHSSPVPEVVVRTALDRLLELSPIDWHARFLARRSLPDPTSEPAPLTRSRRRDLAPPTHGKAELVGAYEHPGYGVLTVAIESAELVARLGRWSSRLVLWHYDTFELTLPGLEARTVLATFRRNARGDFAEVAIPLEPAVDDIVFRRVPERVERDVLQRLQGRYVLDARPQTVVAIELRGGALVAVIAGQPPYRLVPYRRNWFDVEGLAGYSIRFAADGSVATLHQPDADHLLTRIDSAT